MLLELIIYLIILGAVLYVVSILPIDSVIKQVIRVLVVVVVCIYILQILLGHGAPFRLIN